MPTSFARRTTAALAGGALVATGLLLATPTPQAHAVAVNPQAAAAAGWLSDQLDGNGLFTTGFDAVGSTVDFGFSLLATDADPAALQAVTDGLDSVLESYIGTEAEPNASKLAKATAFYEAAGRDITSVEGIDLRQRLENNVHDETGRLGDSGDVYGQVWAVTALNAVGSPEAAAATDFLVKQKCDGGAWGYDFGTCTSVPDGTAYTILALLPQSETNPEAATAIAEGVAWLKGQQRADGGFGDWGVNNNGTTSEGNGTGLAAWALGEAGEILEAQRAARWVADHQLVDVPACAGPVPGEAGALAYDDQNIESAITTGITDVDRGTWVFTGAQALAGLRYLSESSAASVGLSAPTGYVRAGTSTQLDVTGLRPGQTACVSGVGPRQWVVGPESITLAIPAGTANHAVTLNHSDGSTTATIKALDATKLTVKVADRVRANKKAKVKVKSLAPSESVTVKVGKKQATALANAKGVAKVRIKIKANAAKKNGKAKIKATGEFPDRKGKAKVKVI